MKNISKKMINSLKFNELSKIYAKNNPYPHIVIDNFLNEESANKILENFEDVSKWTNCSLVNNFQKYQLNEKNLMNTTSLGLFEELGSKEFLKIVSNITGIKNIFLDMELDGGGLHQIFDKGSLNIHTDYNSHIKNKSWKRVLNILIYLNKNWKEEYKGDLELWDSQVKNKIKTIQPLFNRCVIFRTDRKSYHGHPEKLNLPDGFSRKSIAAYYFIEEYKEIDLFPTNFVARPNDTLFYKFLIRFDTFLNKLFSNLKRLGIVDNNFASNILNLLKKK